MADVNDLNARVAATTAVLRERLWEVMTLDERVSEQTAADVLGVTVDTLRRWRTDGGGPVHYRITARGPVTYRVEALARWIELGRSG